MYSIANLLCYLVNISDLSITLKESLAEWQLAVYKRDLKRIYSFVVILVIVLTGNSDGFTGGWSVNCRFIQS